MTLPVTSFGDNQFLPGVSADAYIPDQLVAGNLKVVTDTVTIGGGAALPRGTVMGLSSFGSLSASTGKTFASGTILVADVPTVGDTLTLGGTPITFVAQNPSGNQVLIGATAAATAQNLLNFLDGSTDANLVKFTYSLSSATITATAAAIGTGGNALTMATSDTGAFTLSGATLSGGTANTGNATVGSISAGPSLQPGNYTAVCLTATTANVFSPSGALIGPLTFGTAFTDPQINFTITAGGTACAAGDTFVISAAPGSGAYVMATGAALDGSSKPVAILADFIDASAGNVNGPVYIMGEFNINAMTFGAGITVAAAKTALRPLGIYLKTASVAADPN